MRMLRGVVVAVVAVVAFGGLAACESSLPPPVRQVVAQCALDGDKVHGGDKDRGVMMTEYVEMCMQARGFVWHAEKGSCEPWPPYDEAMTHPECYRRAT